MEKKYICPVVSLAVLWLASFSPGAVRIKESKETIRTYPFSDPDPVAILARSGSWERNARLYPYHFFDGFSETAVRKDWTVVRMENPYIKLAVLPEVGGKIWGASEKSTGKEFIYTNHVLKFRQIALRGPWTSGGVEFNFGIVGLTIIRKRRSNPTAAANSIFRSRVSFRIRFSCIILTRIFFEGFGIHVGATYYWQLDVGCT